MPQHSRFLETTLDRIHLHRDGVAVLRDVHWRILPGERWLLLGANGAGKTQLLKLIAGDVWPDPRPGTVRSYVHGGEHHDRPLAVREEIAYLGPERHDRWERYGQDYTALAVVGTGIHRTDIPLAPLLPPQQRAALACLGRLGVAHLARRRLLSLSHGERRLVLLARALAWRPGLLLLDEAADGLDAVNRRRLAAWLDASRRSRLPWVHATHHAEDVPRAANRLLLLEQGRVRYAGRMDRAVLDALLRPARTRAAARPRAHLPGPARRPTPRTVPAAAPLVAITGGDVWHETTILLRGVELAVHPGECWMVHGPNGSGKTTLIRTLYGDHPVARPGRVMRLGAARMPVAEFRRHCALVAPHLHGQHLPSQGVLDTVVSGLHASVGLDEPASAAERRRALAVLRELSLDALAGRALREISYGQARRVLFARALVGARSLLLLDEPFAGVDAATRAQLKALIERRVAEGMAVVMSSHHRGDWPACATHELRLRRGVVVRRGSVAIR